MKIKKKTRKKIFRIFIISLISALVALVLGLSYFAYKTIPHLDKISTYKSEDKFFWAEYFYNSKPSKLNEMPKGIIISDKLSDMLQSASILKAVSSISAKNETASRIFLISQIENFTTNSDIYVCRKCRFYDVKGKINIDKDFAEEISSSEIVSANDDIFKSESSVNRILPLVSHFFPKSKITPILISPNAKKENLSRLKNIIKDKNYEDYLFITTTSFSDDEVFALQEIDNISAERSIENFDFENLTDLSVSANFSLYAFMSLMDVLGNRKVVFKDSSALFYEGEKKNNIGTTMVLVGNVFKDFELRILRSFSYDKNYNPKSDLTPFKKLKDIRGKLDSFLIGADNLFFDMEMNDCNSYTQNEFKVSFCKIKEGESVLMDDSDLTVAVVEYKNKDFNDEKKKFMKEIADKGADIVIGRGIPEVLPMEYYNKTAIFYSLGEFLPEAKLFTELNSYLNGAILAVDADLKSIEFRILPVDIFAGYPMISGEELRAKIFKTIVSGLNLSSGKFVIDSKEARISLTR